MADAAIDINQSTQTEGNASLPEENSVWNDKTLKKVNEFRETSNDIKEQRKALSDKLSAKKS